MDNLQRARLLDRVVDDLLSNDALFSTEELIEIGVIAREFRAEVPEMPQQVAEDFSRLFAEEVSE